MTIDEYSKKAYATRQHTTELTNHVYGDINGDMIYGILGLVGESGEAADKIKKVIRNNDGVFPEGQKKEIIKELGDVLWYVNTLAIELGSNLDEVAEMNLIKLYDRLERGVIKSSGDNR